MRQVKRMQVLEDDIKEQEEQEVEVSEDELPSAADAIAALECTEQQNEKRQCVRVTASSWCLPAS